MLTYEECAALMSKARDPGNGKPLANNTRLYQRGSDYAVRYHYTDVVTVHPDGTYTLNTGGWETVTTKQRLNQFGPAHVYSAGKTGGYNYPVWCVWDRDYNDPRTPAKIGKCRACKGTGQQTRPGWTETHGWLTAPAYEVTTRSGYNTTEGTTRTDGTIIGPQPHYTKIVGQVKRTDSGEYGRLQEPVIHPDTVHPCYRCDGATVRDYGSKQSPVVFFDGITVDYAGRVVGADAWPRLHDDAATYNAKYSAMIELYDAGLTADLETQRQAWLTEHDLTVTGGKVLLFKAVNADYETDGYGPRFAYPIGETVTAPDYRPTRQCGQGLHFWPDIEAATCWGASRYLVCAVDYATMVPLGDKVKARSCDVLYEVDEFGNRHP